MSHCIDDQICMQCLLGTITTKKSNVKRKIDKCRQQAGLPALPGVPATKRGRKKKNAREQNEELNQRKKVTDSTAYNQTRLRYSQLSEYFTLIEKHGRASVQFMHKMYKTINACKIALMDVHYRTVFCYGMFTSKMTMHYTM